MFVLPIIEEDYAIKMLSEGIISKDYIDFDRQQSLESFKNYHDLNIRYKSNNFLILVKKEIYDLLINNNNIDLYQCESFGWYNEKVNKINSQIYLARDSKKIIYLQERNPLLKIESFDRYRSDFYEIKYRNMLIGAFGLCYFCFNEDYNYFFKKIELTDDRWIIKRNNIDPKNDYPILLQLFSLTSDNDIRKEIVESNPALKINWLLLKESLNYFSQSTYSMSGFLEHLNKSFSQEPNLKNYAEKFVDMYDIYVRKGLSFPSSDKIVESVKTFIDLAQIDSSRLREFLENNKDFSKTSIFLLGMLLLGDRLDEKFQFDSMISSFVDLSLRYLRDIEINNSSIEFIFDEEKYYSDKRTKKYLVEKYFEAIKKYDDLRNSIELYSEKNIKLETIRNIAEDLSTMDDSIANLNVEKINMQNDYDELVASNAIIRKNIEEHEMYQQQYRNLSNDLSNVENLIKIRQSLEEDKIQHEDHISKLDEEKRRLQNNFDELTANTDILKKRIEEYEDYKHECENLLNDLSDLERIKKISQTLSAKKLEKQEIVENFKKDPTDLLSEINTLEISRKNINTKKSKLTKGKKTSKVANKNTSPDDQAELYDNNP